MRGVRRWRSGTSRHARSPSPASPFAGPSLFPALGLRNWSRPAIQPSLLPLAPPICRDPRTPREKEETTKAASRCPSPWRWSGDGWLFDYWLRRERQGWSETPWIERDRSDAGELKKEEEEKRKSGAKRRKLGPVWQRHRAILLPCLALRFQWDLQWC